MTSVVDTSVKHFHSGMAGAPILNGVAGSMIAVLNACLITGFDTKSATSLVVAGGVATLSFAGTHSATVDSVVLVEGSSIAALNGEQKVTVIGSGFVKFATAEADATATGAITFKMAPAGWTQPFVGTNLATYKSADPASTGMILRVDDTVAQTCRVVGYESMSDVNTGVGAFPSVAQIAGGGYWPKSTASNAVAAPWQGYSDGRTFYISVMPNVPTTPSQTLGCLRGFGDAIPKRPGGDPYLCLLNVSISSVATTEGDSDFSNGTLSQTATPRDYTGLGSAVWHSSGAYVGSSSYTGTVGTLGAFPSVVDGGLFLSKRYVTSGGAPRGDVPGMLHCAQSNVYTYFKPRDIVAGTGVFAGRKLQAAASSTQAGFNSAPTNTVGGIMFMDITGPWR